MEVMKANWPAPTWVHAVTTLRASGVSEAPFRSLNFGQHVGDNPARVERNRLGLQQRFNFTQQPAWLTQTHSTRVLEVLDNTQTQNNRNADGSFTLIKQLPCVVLTADCLPVLFTDTAGTIVCAVHAGWRGLLGGILEEAVKQIRPRAQGELLAWLGPAIGPQAFEVGSQVRRLFMDQDLQAETAFQRTSGSDKWLGDLYSLARMRLRRHGVTGIYGGEHCTLNNPAHFYSYRRDGQTGRMATLIWLGQ